MGPSPLPVVIPGEAGRISSGIACLILGHLPIAQTFVRRSGQIEVETDESSTSFAFNGSGFARRSCFTGLFHGLQWRNKFFHAIDGAGDGAGKCQHCGWGRYHDAERFGDKQLGGGELERVRGNSLEPDIVFSDVYGAGRDERSADGDDHSDRGGQRCGEWDDSDHHSAGAGGGYHQRKPCRHGGSDILRATAGQRRYSSLSELGRLQQRQGSSGLPDIECYGRSDDLVRSGVDRLLRGNVQQRDLHLG